ncbi:MAG: prolyl oligopeptidase family serine peptidase [Clostridiales bacterium]|nr:prolyl oligopeptidase family serine peptidase [Clostridiales bacterium]
MAENEIRPFAEDKEVSLAYREHYLSSVNGYLARLRKESESKRRAFITPEKLAADPEGYRAKYRAMLGAPLTEYEAVKDEPVRVISDGRIDGVFFDMDGGRYEMRRMRLGVLEDFEMYGILFLPEGGVKEPSRFVISQHGGGGTPELCSDFYGDTNYNHLTRRILSRGAVVFAPQLLLWTPENFGLPYDRRMIDNELKKFGSSITALEVTGIMRAIDHFCAQPYVDPSRVGMAGLSYGGFYTLMTAAADPRVKAAYTSCALIDMVKRQDFSDWAWKGSGITFNEAEIAALIAPRAYCVDAGENDELFGAESTREMFARAKEFFEAQGAGENIFLKVFPGTHELDPADDCFDFFFEKLG